MRIPLGRWHMAARPSTPRLMVRLEGRDDLGRDQALAQLGDGLPTSEVADLAQVEIEFGVPLGLLRGDDRLDVLLAPFPIGNPLTWLGAEAALEDGVSEVNYQLKRRGALRDRSPQTVRELFEVWLQEANGLTSA
jgi:hypothetical protein